MTVEEKNKQIEKTWTIFRVIEAIVLITLGVLDIVYYNKDFFQQWIFYILGSLLAVDGILNIVKYYLEPMDASSVVQEFIVSIFEISLGILFIVKASSIVDLFKDLLVWFIAVLCFSSAFVFGLGATIGIVNKKRKMWVAITEYVVCALLIAAGVLLIYYRDDAKGVILNVLIVLCGLIMVAIGVYALVTSFLPFRSAKPKKVKAEKVDDKKQGPIDVAAEKKDEEEHKPIIVDVDTKQISEEKNDNPQIVNKDEDKKGKKD